MAEQTQPDRIQLALQRFADIRRRYSASSCDRDVGSPVASSSPAKPSNTLPTRTSSRKRRTTDSQCHVSSVKAKRIRQQRCKECGPCKSEDCRECIHCKDRKKYGGPGRLRKACIHRKCEAFKQEPDAARKLFQDSSGDSSDDELSNIKRMLAGERKNKVPTPSKMAASLVDPATEAKEEPKDCDTSSETEAGDSSDDELPSIKLMLTDEKNGIIKSKAPTPVKLQGSPSKMAASVVDPAPEAKEEPKDCDTSSETEAGDSSDDELPSVKLMLVDEKHGTKGKAPTPVKLQGSPSKMAASAVDPATEAKDRPKDCDTSSETEAGDSSESDDELPSVKLMLTDEKHGTNNEGPTPAKLQGSPSKMAASVVDPATEAIEEPKDCDTSSETEAGDSSESVDELPAVDLRLVDEENGIEPPTHENLQRNPSLMSGSLVDPAPEAKEEPKVDSPGPDITELLQPIMQKMERGDEKVTELQNELKVKETELSLLRQTGREQSHRIQQLEAAGKRQELEIAELREEAGQSSQHMKMVEQQLKTLQERISQLEANSSQPHVTRLRRLSRQQASQIQDQQKRLRDREKETVELKEQERKMKEWLASIPMHGVQITLLSS